MTIKLCRSHHGTRYVRFLLNTKAVKQRMGRMKNRSIVPLELDQHRRQEQNSTSGLEDQTRIQPFKFTLRDQVQRPEEASQERYAHLFLEADQSGLVRPQCASASRCLLCNFSHRLPLKSWIDIFIMPTLLYIYSAIGSSGWLRHPPADNVGPTSDPMISEAWENSPLALTMSSQH